MDHDLRSLLVLALEEGAATLLADGTPIEVMGELMVEDAASAESFRRLRENSARAEAILGSLPPLVRWASSTSAHFAIDLLSFAHEDFIGRRGEDAAYLEIVVTDEIERVGLNNLPLLVALGLAPYRDLGLKIYVSLDGTRPGAKTERGPIASVPRLLTLPYAPSHPNVLMLVREPAA